MTTEPIYINLHDVPNYNEILAELQSELDRLTRIRENTEKQIEQLMKAVATIQLIAEGEDRPIMEPPPLPPEEEQGFTDQVRAILKANPATPLSAVAIRDLMLVRDPKQDSKITLIHIHNTLKRLIRQDEITEVQLFDGRTGYRVKMTPVVDLMVALKESLAKLDDKRTAAKKNSLAERTAKFEAELQTAKAAAGRKARQE